MSDRKQKIIEIMQDSSSYRKIALQGKPCPTFPELSADSTDEDIEKVTTAFYEKNQPKSSAIDPDCVKRACDPDLIYVIKTIFKLYADEYVQGARERRNTSTGWNLQSNDIR